MLVLTTDFVPHATVYFGLVTLNADKRKANKIILLNVTRVFNHLPGERFSVKFKSFGLAIPVWSRLTSYFSHVVSINVTLSQLQRINGGLLQGSVLGRLLFLLYSSDIF